MATTADLSRLGFEPSQVTATQLNINHPDPRGLGPFCRLKVATNAPTSPGVYAWVITTTVMYIGKANFLLHVVHGAHMQRAYNDYTYIPPSKVAQTSSPRVRINGLLNHTINTEQQPVTWWWLQTPTTADASRLEADLIHKWAPP